MDAVNIKEMPSSSCRTAMAKVTERLIPAPRAIRTRRPAGQLIPHEGYPLTQLLGWQRFSVFYIKVQHLDAGLLDSFRQL